MKNYMIIFLILVAGCAVTKQQAAHKTSQDILISKEQIELPLKDLGGGWFDITETAAIENITPRQAKEIAVKNACKRAVEYYGGVQISGKSIDIKAQSDKKVLIDNFFSLMSQTTEGIILEKQIIDERIISKGNRSIKIVRLKVKIDKQKGKRDPYFKIQASLNRKYFKEGEQLELSAKASKDCYLNILNICSNDSVYIIFPNQFRKNNFIKAGQNFSLPNLEDKEKGILFQVNLLPDKKKDMEMIKIIATKEKLDFSSIYSFSSYGTHQATFRDLQKWLLKIPRDQVEEVDLQYFIVK